MTARWRESCGATTRTGRPCQAPAIPGGYVCRVHGGSAPQVRFQAGLRWRQHVLVYAEAAWREKGTLDSLGRYNRARRELASFEAKLRLLAELRRRKRAGTPPVLPPRNPDGTFRRAAG